VIDDSAAWRDELVAVADRLEAATKQKRWGDRTEFLIERDFVWSAYILRKLTETGTAADNRRRCIPARRYDVTATPADDIADSYDLDNGRRQRRVRILLRRDDRPLRRHLCGIESQQI
jgi:hypothetical protein